MGKGDSRHPRINQNYEVFELKSMLKKINDVRIFYGQDKWQGMKLINKSIRTANLTVTLRILKNRNWRIGPTTVIHWSCWRPGITFQSLHWGNHNHPQFQIQEIQEFTSPGSHIWFMSAEHSVCMSFHKLLENFLLLIICEEEQTMFLWWNVKCWVKIEGPLDLILSQDMEKGMAEEEVHEKQQETQCFHCRKYFKRTYQEHSAYVSLEGSKFGRLVTLGTSLVFLWRL